ncbi:MAG TPA: response regulator transcription factor [Geminicoccaceae bacterium]|nr:response regulator transcription factor [Geminicoccaceae bacterium]
MTIRLVVADDHPLVVDGLLRLFEQHPDLLVLASCGDGETALALVRAHRPDVLLLDLQLPGLDGLGVLRRLRAEATAVKVVLLTGGLAEEQLLEAVRLGVRGVVLKEMASALVVACLRRVAAGGQWLERDIMARALDRLLAREAEEQRMRGILTQRERELVTLVATGARNKEIGRCLGITEGTVKIHLHRIFEKLGVTNRVELANYARERLK